MASPELAHYTIVEQIGEGGMGVVYKARDNRLNRTVVLKALKVTDRERQRRLVQEAQTASQLNHQNITAVYDFTSMDGADYLVMEYVPGRTLGQVIPKRGMRLNDALKYSNRGCSGSGTCRRHRASGPEARQHHDHGQRHREGARFRISEDR